MRKNETFVFVYRIVVNSDMFDRQAMDNFIEAISDYSITSNETQNEVIITVCEDSLNYSKICNLAIMKLGNNNFTMETLGMLGPFKRSY